MAVLLYHTFAFFALFLYGIYHLVSVTRFHLKTPPTRDYTARPYHPLPLPHRLLRHIPLYLSILSLLLSILHHALLSSSSTPNPLLPLLRFTSLQTSLSLLLFLLLSLSLLLPFPLPSDLLFLLSSLAFSLFSSISYHSSLSSSPNDLQSKCDSVSSLISAASAFLSLALAFHPRLLVAELALAASISLQGVWILQTGLSLYVEAFIPEGCHRLLDVPSGIEGSTRCDLEKSRLRAAAVMDLAFVMHTTFVAVVAVVVYAAVARAVGGLPRRHNGSYDALPTSSSGGALNDLDHVQMKAITKNSMQQA